MSLIPLLTGGRGGGGGARPGGMPTLVSAPLSNSLIFWDDFTEGGIVGTPSSGTGPPTDWYATSIGGGSPTYGLSGSSAAGSGHLHGIMQTVTPAVAGQGAQLERMARSITSNTGQNLCYVPAGRPWVYMFRFAMSSLTANNWAAGWVSSAVGVGSNLISDPDTTIGTNASLIVHSVADAAGYSGDAAGEVVLRVYGAAGATSVVLASSITANTIYKVELAMTTAGSLRVYINRTLTQTLDLSAWTGFTTAWTTRPYFGNVLSATGTAGTRAFNMDCFYTEVGLAAAR